MKNNTSVWKMNQNGNYVFHTEEDFVKLEHKAGSIFERPAVAYIVMFLCAGLDFIMFKQLFGNFLYDSLFIQYMSILGMLIGFDFVPIYLGMKIREKQQGYNVKTLLIVLLVSAFAIAFVLNVWLRLDMKDLVLPDLSNFVQSFSGKATVENQTSSHALIYAIFAACLPLVTSLGSLGVSYATYNPLKDEVLRLQTKLNILNTDLLQTNSILKEYEADKMDEMFVEDRARYHIARNTICEMAFFYCNYTRQCLKEHIGSPSSTNELSRFDYGKLAERLKKTMDIINMEGISKQPQQYQ